MTTTVGKRSFGTSASHPEFPRLKQKIIKTTGLQYYADKDQTLADHVEHRRATLGCSMAEYFRRTLDARDTEELAALIDDVTVGETYFFRYPQQFEALRQVVLPECVARRQGNRALRIWSAGCASGAEPYSLSILLRCEFAGLLHGWQISILGTDINRRALDQARAGLFTGWELRTATDQLKRQCFVESGKHWKIRPAYQEGVRFERQNLIDDMDTFGKTYAGTFDIIFCRNVMIYFASDAMRRLVRGFRDCLMDGGWLFVGHAEPYFEIAHFLSPVAVAGATVYRKRDDDLFVTAAARPPWAPALDPVHDVLHGNYGTNSHLPPDAGADAAVDAAGSGSFDFPAIAPAMTGEMTTDASTVRRSVKRQAHASANVLADLEEIRRSADAGEWNTAMAACELAIQRHPLEPAVYYTYALLSEHIGTPAAAEEAFRRAIYLDRGFALAHYHLGRCQAHRGARAGAARSFANALRLLAGCDNAEALVMGDGITAGELREMIFIHEKLLEER